MLAHDLGPDDVVSGLAKANIIESAGRVLDSHRMLLTVVTANISQPEQVAAVPIANVGGQPVIVRDIGSVDLGIREDYIRTASEDGPALLIGISRQPSGNTVEISNQARQLMEQLRLRYPDVSFSLSYDQAALVTESFKSVRDAIVLGLALAVLVVLLFTGSTGERDHRGDRGALHARDHIRGDESVRDELQHDDAGGPRRGHRAFHR